MSLLIVEDDIELRGALKRSAASLFDDIDEASSAYEAILIIAKKNPRVVVSDWDLGEELTGIDIANYVAQHAANTRFVLISGKPLQHIKVKANTTHLTVDNYIAKPFSIAEFRSIIRRLIDSA